MANLDRITNENNKKWSYIPDHPYRICMTGCPNAFIECSNMMDDVYENIDD